MTSGDRVRSLIDILADDGSMVPLGSRGVVVGFEGDRIVVTFEDPETDTSRAATVQVWEVRR